MIEKTVKDYLESQLKVPVVLETINKPEYVLISKTGGGENNHIYSATFAIQSYSDTLYNAALLNDVVKKAMLGDDESAGIADLDEICNCTLNSDYNYTDTTNKKYRYQAVFDINHY